MQLDRMVEIHVLEGLISDKDMTFSKRFNVQRLHSKSVNKPEFLQASHTYIYIAKNFHMKYLNKSACYHPIMIHSR